MWKSSSDHNGVEWHLHGWWGRGFAGCKWSSGACLSPSTWLSKPSEPKGADYSWGRCWWSEGCQSTTLPLLVRPWVLLDTKWAFANSNRNGSADSSVEQKWDSSKEQKVGVVVRVILRNRTKRMCVCVCVCVYFIIIIIFIISVL